LSTPDPRNDLRPVDTMAIFEMIRTMNDGLMTQAKATNNNVAGILRASLQLQETIGALINSLTETRDKRYQEEIDDLEGRINGLVHSLEEKKSAKVDNRSTSEKMIAAAKEATAQLKAEEQKRTGIDWYDMRNYAIKTAIAIIVGAGVWYLAPIVARVLGEMFTR